MSHIIGHGRYARETYPQPGGAGAPGFHGHQVRRVYRSYDLQ